MHTLCKHTLGVKSCQLVEVKNFTSDFSLTYCGQISTKKSEIGRFSSDGLKTEWQSGSFCHKARLT